MIMTMKWKIAAKIDDDFKDKFPEINPVVLQLLYNRRLKDQESLDRFLGPDYKLDQHDPYLFNDMKKAVDIIYQVIRDHKKICIYGDYDADGVSSTALMHLALKRIGAEYIHIHIPNRLNEGYGINQEAVQELIETKIDLIISVDCGITAIAEVKMAQDAGIKVIVTDHHLPGNELPKADALIVPTVKNEKYPFKKLAGVGVAFKLAQALLRSPEGGQNNEAFEKWLLDLVAIGTVADMVPLLGENRTLVKWGLLVLNKTQRLGLKELIAGAAIKGQLGTYNIGYQLAPRINAAGRMDHANTAYELLISADEAEALAIANDLNQKNTGRQKATDEMMKISLEQIGQPTDNVKILFSQYDGWSAGLVGLAAGKLADKFHRPAIVFGKMGDKYVGSGRSISEFNITESLEQCAAYLEEFGGHEQACGLTIVGADNYEKFIKRMKELAAKKLTGVELIPSLEIEAEIELSQANWDLIDSLEKFEPFGQDNQQPVFLTKNMEVTDKAMIGGSGQHLRLNLAGKKFLAFNKAEECANINPGDKLDVAYKINVNEWNGNREIEFKIVDMKKL